MTDANLPHPEERSQTASRRTHAAPPVLFTAATLAFPHSDDSPLVRHLLQHVGEGGERGPAVLREGVDAAAFALEPAVDVVQQDPADIGDEPGGAYNRILLSEVLAGKIRQDDIQLATKEWYAAQGVTMIDPSATYIDTTVELATDVTLFPGAMAMGPVCPQPVMRP